MLRGKFFIGSLLATTLLVSVVARVGCKEVQNGCDKLDKHLITNLPNELDAAKNYELALKVSALSFAKNKVVKSWKLVHEAVESKSCSEAAIEAWKSFGKCYYDQERLAAVLKPELILFSSICQEQILNFLQQEQKKYEAQVYPSVRKPLFQFLSEYFIAKYLESNADEAPVYLGKSASGQQCCTADDGAVSATIDSLQTIVKDKGQTALSKLNDRTKLREMLEEYLFLPCETYQQLMYHHLYRELIQALHKYAPNIELKHLIEDTRSSDFKFAIFRYQFCYNFKSLDSRKQFANRIISALAEKRV